MNYTPLDIGSLSAQPRAVSINPPLPPEKPVKNFPVKPVAIVAGIVLSVTLIATQFGNLQKVFTKASDSAPRNITAETLSKNQASVQWSTDQETQAVIAYGTSAAKLDRLLPEKQPSKTHVILFGGIDTEGIPLEPDTTYYFNIRIGDKTYDNNGEPWVFTTSSTSTISKTLSPTVTQAIRRPTQSVVAYIPPTSVPLPTLASVTCGSRDCISICRKIGISCSSSDWMRSGCVGKVSLSGCTEITGADTKPALSPSPPAAKSSSSASSQKSAGPTAVPTAAPPAVQYLRKPSDIETFIPFTSKNYKLYTDSPKQLADSYLQFFEAFRIYFSNNYFDVSATPVVSVYMFSKPDDYFAYSGGKAESNYGYYQYGPHLLVTHGQAGTGTYAHELVHSFVDSRMSVYPGWFSEGLPTFFEKIVGYYDSQQGLKLVVGFQNPWRVQEYAAGLAYGTVKKPTISMTAQWPISDNSEPAHDIDRFMSLYLYQRGWLKAYVNKLLASPSKDLDAGYMAAVSGKSLQDLETDYSVWLDNVKNDAVSTQSTLPLVPISNVFPNKTEWDKWVGIHRSELQKLGVNFDI